ncbi:hypothetical protein [Halomonas sp. CKK8]|nr:hypothetical protein [Halomonas sp. CKK8]WFM72937.1 hypothetical protein P8934_08065 [Halomonas sp. CKK8]
MTPLINAGLLLAIAGFSIALGLTLRQLYREFAGVEDEGGRP